jgi:hypothetical protein
VPPFFHGEYTVHPLQEKFQITVPAKEEGAEPWVPANATWNIEDGNPAGCLFNQLPPGMEIRAQHRSRQHNMAFVMSGDTDVSKDTNPMAYAEGFTKRDMKAIDDQYTGEHVEHFYGDAGGFVERNNYLDRE